MKNTIIKKQNVIWIIAAIQIVLSVVFGIQLLIMDLLPMIYVVLYVLVMLLLFILTLLLSKKKWGRTIMCVISILVSIVLIYGVVALGKVHSTLEEVTSKGDEVKTEMVILVLVDSKAENMTDLSQFLVAYTQTEDMQKVAPIMDEINESVGGEVSFHEFADVFEMVDAFYSKTINAVIMNRAYIDVISDTEGYEDFSEETKIIYSYEVIDYINLVDEKESNLDQFVVYISGIDVWGHVSVKSRSDVNILAVVNTNTKQIQLINTPRDYYVEMPISDGVKDKLTHAGIYGVDNSIGALESLYGIKIDYYVRMNFSGYEKIIDSLGGIDVYSEYDFTVEPIKHYVKGMNHLTGLEALAFARERHSFATGDVQRGKNQMAVITAMVDELMSPELLYNYVDVLEALEDCFQTNMTSENIYTLIKQQLVNPGEWSIETYSVTGTGGSEVTYSSPNSKCYVMLPNEDDIQIAKEKISAVLETE